MKRNKRIKYIFLGAIACITPCLLFAEDKGNDPEPFTPIEAFDDFGGWVQTARLDVGIQFLGSGVFSPIAPAMVSGSIGDLPDSIPDLDDLKSDILTSSSTQNFLIVPENTESLTLMSDTGISGEGISLNNSPDAYPQLLGFSSYLPGADLAGNHFVSVDEDKLYLIEWNLSTPFEISDTTKLPFIRFAAGSLAAGGLGMSNITFDANSSNQIVGDEVVLRQYFHAHATGEMGFEVVIYDGVTENVQYNSVSRIGYPNGHIGHNVTINKIEVFEVDESQLSGKEVVFNEGQESVPLFTDEPAPDPSNYTGGFELDYWGGRDFFQFLADGAGASRNTSIFPDRPIRTPSNSVPFERNGDTADILTFSVNSGEGPMFITWDTQNSRVSESDGSDPANFTAEEVLEVEEGELVFMDFWLSAIGATANLPFTRVGISHDFFGPGGEELESLQGFFAFHEFSTNFDGLRGVDGSTIPNALTLQNGSSRRVRLVFEPQLVSTPVGSPGRFAFRPTIQSFEIPVVSNSRSAEAEGFININRVVVTRYDAPDGIESLDVPSVLNNI